MNFLLSVATPWKSPEGVTAIATSLATLAAIGAGLFAALSFKNLKKQNDNLAEQKTLISKQVALAKEERATANSLLKKDQASRFLVWTEVIKNDSDQAKNLVLKIQNASSLPVYQILIGIDFGISTKSKVYYLRTLELLPPTGPEAEVVDISVIRPDVLTKWHEWHPSRTVNKAPKIEIFFRDVNQNYWNRKADGVLAESTKQDGVPKHWARLSAENKAKAKAKETPKA